MTIAGIATAFKKAGNFLGLMLVLAKKLLIRASSTGPRVIQILGSYY
jgi:hypothetical protein